MTASSQSSGGSRYPSVPAHPSFPASRPSGVFVTYNSERHLQRLFPGVLRSAFDEVIAVDNGSSDRSVDVARDAGFRTRVEFEDTDDPVLDGIVTSQDPAGGTQAKPDSIVVLFVGRFVGTTTEETQTTPTP